MLLQGCFNRFLLISCMLVLAASCTSRHTLSRDNSPPASSKTENTRKKYAAILSVPEEDISNFALYDFIDKWVGTPYLYGGKTKNGIDCSGFTERLYAEVYQKELSGSSKDLFLQCKTVSREKLKEGDLLFFRIESDKISHVGVYLANDRFVHATVHKGVMISDLKETYYTKYFYKAGRLE